MRQDLRFAIRSLFVRPGFAAVAIATLGLGIGANVAIFSVVHAVLLRPLPYAEPDRLVRVLGLDLEDGEPDNLAPADFLDIERDTTVFDRVGAHGWVGTATVTGAGGGAERVGRVQVTEGFFPTLGVQPALGRLPARDEDRPGGDPVALLGHGFWQRRYGGNPAIVGDTITVNAQPVTVVGVLPPDYLHIESHPDRQPDLFMPFQFDPAGAPRSAHFTRAVGRVRAGASVGEAHAELTAMADRFRERFPESKASRGLMGLPLHDALVAEGRPALILLSVAVGVVLLVACANVANLLLARGTARQRELAVRTAMGAGRGRLVRQMLTESLVLGLAGAAVGLVLAVSVTDLLASLAQAGMPHADRARLDLPVLAFVLGVAVVASVLAGLVPALQLSRGALHESLKEGGRQSATGVRRHAREVLIAAEVALSIVLLVAAGLLTRSLWQLQDVAPGFAAGDVLSMEASLPLARYEEGTQIPFYQRFEDRLRALRGVQEVGAINILPLGGGYDSRGIQIDAAPSPPGQEPSPQFRSVTTGYFRAMGIPLVAGRYFDVRDTEGMPRVVIISEAMARRYWPDTNPIGERITFNAGIPRDEQQEVGGPGSREIVGVVADVKHLGLDERAVPMFYTPHAQQPSYHTMVVTVRTDADPASLARAARAELAQMDPEVPLYQVRPLGDIVDRTVAAPRVRANLIGLFALLALALASLGVYGVVGYLVAQRTQEIGVRVALGARGGDVVRLLMGQGLRPVAAGILVGVAGAVAASRLLETMLFGVAPSDAMSYAIAAGTLAAAAVVATLVPARRALAVDPVVALRNV